MFQPQRGYGTGWDGIMKDIPTTLLAIVVALAAVLVPAGPAVTAPDEASFRFGDELVCRQARAWDRLVFCIMSARDGTGVMPAVFQRRGQDGREEIWRDYDRGFSPWKLVLAELDGDPLPEVALGVHKATRHDPAHRRRLFVYDWTGSGLAPRWLGSSLGLPLVDFHFARDRGAGRDHLVSLERGPHRAVVRRYRWNGFGFTATRTLASTDDGTGWNEIRATFRTLTQSRKQ